MSFLIQMPGPGVICIVSHTMHELLARLPILPKPYFIIISHAEFTAAFFKQDNIIKSNPVTLRINMKLTHCDRLIPRS